MWWRWGLLVVVLLLLVLVLNRKHVVPDPYHIVVARYNEDPWSWLPKDDPYVKMYNKGTHLDKSLIVNLPNVGRESHTYLTYIIDNYDMLPDIVFFTQGAPDHTGGFSVDYFTSIPGSKSENFYTIRGDDCGLGKEGRLFEYYGKLYPAETNFFDWFTMYVSKSVDPRGDIMWCPGATFSVRREKILSRSKEYYVDLLNQFPKDHPNPEIGHFFERSWYYIFNCDT
jgi:hypothetical protein